MESMHDDLSIVVLGGHCSHWKISVEVARSLQWGKLARYIYCKKSGYKNGYLRRHFRFLHVDVLHTEEKLPCQVWCLKLCTSHMCWDMSTITRLGLISAFNTSIESMSVTVTWPPPHPTPISASSCPTSRRTNQTRSFSKSGLLINNLLYIGVYYIYIRLK